MPHHCAEAISYQYHGILGVMMSPEAERAIEIMSALSAAYAIASRYMRRAIITLSSISTIVLLVSVLGNGTAAKVAHQLSPCFSAITFATAAPGVIGALWVTSKTAP
jgi:hypothetical protein